MDRDEVEVTKKKNEANIQREILKERVNNGFNTWPKWYY